MRTSAAIAKQGCQQRVRVVVTRIGNVILKVLTLSWNWIACVRWITLNGLTVVFILLVMLPLIVLEVIWSPSMVVQPISVPPDLVNMGYTPDVMAHRLVDSIHEVRQDVRAIMKKIGLKHNSPELDFNVPTIGLSIKTIATYLNDLFLRPRITVSGELLSLKGAVSLRLRINKEKMTDITIPGELNEAGMNKLLRDSAYQMIKKIDSSILDKTEDQLRILNLQASLHFDDNEREQALKKIEKSIELDSNYAATYIIWGIALVGEGDHDEAIEQFKKAAELVPEDAAPYQGWGIALVGKGDHDEAIEQFKKAVELDPEDAAPYQNWGVALLRKGDHDGAIEQFKKAIELDPEDANSYRNWGATLVAVGDCKGAIAKYKKATEIDGLSAEAPCPN